MDWFDSDYLNERIAWSQCILGIKYSPGELCSFPQLIQEPKKILNKILKLLNHVATRVVISLQLWGLAGLVLT